MRCVLVGALVCASWLSGGRSVGGADGKEERPAAKAAPGAPSPQALPPPTEAELKIAAALAKPADVDWVETPLSDVAAHLSEKYGLSIQLDVQSLAADGLGADTPITKKFHGVSLKQVLLATLHERGMTYVVRFDQLTITTVTAADCLVRTRVYPVHDLVVQADDRTAERPDFETLIEVVTSNVAPETWREAGGTQGEVRPFLGPGVAALIVTQTDAAHERIDELLAALRKAQSDPVRQAQARQAKGADKGAAQGADGAAPASFAPGKIYPQRSEAEDRLTALLDQPADIEWVEVRLADVLDEFRQKYRLPIQIDGPALAADGVDLDGTVSMSAGGTTVRCALRLVLEEFGLTYDLRYEQLLITTRQAADQLVSVRVYQVHDLVMPAGDPSALRRDTEQLHDLITSTIVPESWRESGGTVGEIREYVGNGVIALVITHNRAGHEWTESLLDAVREARADSVRNPQAGKPGQPDVAPAGPAPYYPKPTEIERRIAAALEQPADFEWIETQLGDVAAEITAKFRLPIEIDVPALTAEGKSHGVVRITKTFQKTSVRNVLNRTLREQGLTFLFERERLWITTRAAAETKTMIRIYPVTDLIAMSGGTPQARGDDEPLIQMIFATVDPDTWRYQGGTQGEIKELVANGVVVLAITQIEEAHDKIVRLLGALRAARSDAVGRGQRGKEPVANTANGRASARYYPEPSAAEHRIAAGLAKPADIQWPDIPLGEVALYLADAYGLPVQLDVPALTADGKGSETLINKSVKGVRLENGLRSALSEQGLTFVIVDDQVLITTRTAAEAYGSVRIYPVHDLVAMPRDPAAAHPRWKPLVEAIAMAVRPESWRSAGGAVGEIQGYAGPGLAVLAIHQTDAGHAETDQLLESLRQAQSDAVRETQSRRRTGPVRVDSDDDSLDAARNDERAAAPKHSAAARAEPR